MSKAKHLTDLELNIIHSMIKEGYKATYIAKKLNRQPCSIYKILGMDEKRQYKKWTVEEKAKAKNLKKQGINITEIAKLLGRNRVTVSNMFFIERKRGWIE